MAEPTLYDLEQDSRIESLESLITAEYQPPAGAQYSYPVASQGITQDQWQQMNLHTGDGVIISDGSEFPFDLTGHTTDSETNQRNTLILRVSRNTGKNEAALAGFYFRQTEDIELPFPPVTTTTVYHVTVTYDPRKFKTEPLRIEVWAGEPPRAHGQKHLLLKTVQRNPSQLLSQSTIETYRHHVAPTIVATSEDRLPNADDVLYGTLGVTRNRTSSGSAIPGTGQIYESRGIHGWHNLLIGDVVNVTPVHTNTASAIKAQHVIGGMHISGRMNVGSNTLRTGNTIARLPSTHAVSQGTWRDTVYTTQGVRAVSVSGRDISFLLDDLQGWIDVNTFVPASYL